MFDEKKIDEILNKHIGEIASVDDLKTMLKEAYAAGNKAAGNGGLYLTDDMLELLNYAQKISKIIGTVIDIQNVTITGEAIKFTRFGSTDTVQVSGL